MFELVLIQVTSTILPQGRQLIWVFQWQFRLRVLEIKLWGLTTNRMVEPTLLDLLNQYQTLPALTNRPVVSDVTFLYYLFYISWHISLFYIFLLYIILNHRSYDWIEIWSILKVCYSSIWHFTFSKYVT